MTSTELEEIDVSNFNTESDLGDSFLNDSDLDSQIQNNGTSLATPTGWAPKYFRKNFQYPSATFGWVLIDGGFAIYAATLNFIGPWLTHQAASVADSDGYVYLGHQPSHDKNSPSDQGFGIPLHKDSVFSLSVSISIIFQIICLPILGAYAEGDVKTLKRHLRRWIFIGACLTSGMALVLQNHFWWLSCILFIFSNLMYGAGVVFYNAYLVHVTHGSLERDEASSIGFSFGYGIALLVMIGSFALFSTMPYDVANRIILAFTGIGFLIFVYFASRKLPPHKKSESVFNLLRSSTDTSRSLDIVDPTLSQGPLHEIEIGTGTEAEADEPSHLEEPHQSLLHKLKFAVMNLYHYMPNSLWFLIACALYLDAIHTVTTLASTYAQEELELPFSFIALCLVVVNLVALFGALLFMKISEWMKSTSRAIIISLFIWSAVILFTVFLEAGQEWQFFVVAMVIGLVLGGTQALTRSLFSRMIPEENCQIYWSLYEVSDRGSSFLGPLVFGIVQNATQSMRPGIFALIFFFGVGLIIMFKIDFKQALHDVKSFEEHHHTCENPEEEFEDESSSTSVPMRSNVDADDDKLQDLGDENFNFELED